MKIPFLNIWVTRMDWEFLYNYERGVLKNERRVMNDYLSKQRETFLGKDGRLRFKHNGQFAPDDRSRFKRIHDQLRAEVNQPIDYAAVKKASKI
jgi:hypothetical protein